MEVLEPECMHAAGLIPDLDGWRKKEIRYNTKALYTVNKCAVHLHLGAGTGRLTGFLSEACRYNLIREDSEGYAKLIVALNHFGQAALTDDLVPGLYREIQVRVNL